MSVEIISAAAAAQADGVRLVVVPAIPSPWTEAVKGLLHLRGIPWQGVYLDRNDPAVAAFSGTHNAPVLVYNREAGISGWFDILQFCENHGTGEPLLPADEDARAAVLDWCRLLADPGGLGWYRRLQAVALGMAQQAGGFPQPVAQYLAAKYGYDEQQVGGYEGEVISRLAQLAQQLRQQQARGVPYLCGDSLSAADIYSACFLAYLKPLDESLCAMNPVVRQVFESLTPGVAAALDNVIVGHRDYIYQHYLQLPVQL
jgi:glutathione S-transferase